MSKGRLRNIAVVALGLWALPAVAQGADPRAEALFREGREALTTGDLPTACARFEESLALESSVGALLNLADCEERRGRLARSLSLWKEGLAKMPPDDGRRDLAQRRVTELERRAPKIVVSAPEGARILVGSEVAQAGVPHLVDPGKHVIVVSGSGAPRRFEVEVAEGQALPVDATSGAPAAAPAETSAPPMESASPSMLPAAIAYGVGGAGLVLFGVTGALWLGEKSTVDTECPDRRCTPDGLSAGESGQTLGVVNAIGLGTFVVGAGLGTLFLVTASSSEGAASSAPATARVSWTGSGARLDGTF